MGGHKRRAHNACLFKAAATAVALLQIANERTVFKRKGENGLEWKLRQPPEVFAEVIVDSGRASALRRLDITTRCFHLENFSRIKNIFRIEHSFDLTHHSQQVIAKLLPHVLSARDANAVLRGKRTFELAHECR